MLILRAFLFYLGITLAALVFALLVPLLLPFPYRQRYRVLTGWGRFAIWWLGKTCQLNYQVQGLENLPTAPAIVLSKHQSAWETLVYQEIFPPQIWLLKREVLWIPVFGWGLATLKPIAIDRKVRRDSLQQIVEPGKQRLAQGLWVVIFPEGSRVAPGKKKRYGIGGAYLAEKSGYPVVPVAHNSGKFWPRQSFIKYPGTIQVIIGPVIESTGKSYKEINALAEEWIEKTALTLIEEGGDSEQKKGASTG